MCEREREGVSMIEFLEESFDDVDMILLDFFST
jgi:hypothetical protein